MIEMSLEEQTATNIKHLLQSHQRQLKQIETLTEHVNTLLGKYSNCQQTTEELKRQIRQLQEEIDALKKDNAALSQRVSMLENENQRLAQEKKNLEEKLKTYQTSA